MNKKTKSKLWKTIAIHLGYEYASGWENNSLLSNDPKIQRAQKKVAYKWAKDNYIHFLRSARILQNKMQRIKQNV